MTENQIFEHDHNKIFDYHPGEHFHLHLDENPGTGFQWTENPTFSETIELLSTGFERVMPETAGSGGTRNYKFRAKKPGIANIHLELKRSHDSRVHKTFDVTIKVSDTRQTKRP